MTPAEQKAVEILRKRKPYLNALNLTDDQILSFLKDHISELLEMYNSGWNDAVKEAANLFGEVDNQTILKLLK